jgi:aminomethyltransferase
MKKTPLYEKHCELGGKMIEFGGWLMPVQYTGIIEEHESVRNAAGLFDVSHMGEITVRGRGATRFIQKLVTNDISRATAGRCVYSPMCYPDGGVVDDLLIYKNSSEDYLIVVNASNTDRDFAWFTENLEGEAEIENVSDSIAQLALQGPKAEMILQSMTQTPLAGIGFYRFQNGVSVCGEDAIVSRTGYTGEDGFEIYLPREKAAEVWDKILEAGKGYGIVPVGLGARDTLRFEVALPLYGHELSESITPLQAGLDKFVKLDKDDFIGRDALITQKAQGLKSKIAGFEMTGRGIARNGCEVFSNGVKIGVVTTGNYSPSLKKNLGLALVDTDHASIGARFDIMIRNKPVEAAVVPFPFYSKHYRSN